MKGIIRAAQTYTLKQFYKKRIEEHQYLKRKWPKIFWN